MRWKSIVFSMLVAASLAGPALVAQTSAPAAVPAVQSALPDFQGTVPETFMLKGKILKVEDIPVGLSKPRKVTLEYNGEQHQAVFKSIDVYQPGFTQYANGGGEREFQDTWMTEIAAYEIDKLIGLKRVPATVGRSVKGEEGSLQWWVDSMMAEADRSKQGLVPPDLEAWNREAANVRLFDNLIWNADNHMNNVLIAKDWSLRLIDHSRSFRPFKELKTPKDFGRFSRTLLENIKKLERSDLQKRLGKYLRSDQVTAIIQRRDAILALAKDLVAQKGEDAVLFP